MLKTNWLKTKIDYIRDLVDNAQQQGGDAFNELLNSLEFRNEEDIAKLKPTKSNPKEVPFIKNNPREKELAGPTAAAQEGSAAPLTAADI